jgi:hypothetical protein
LGKIGLFKNIDAYICVLEDGFGLAIDADAFVFEVMGSHTRGRVGEKKEG